MKEKEIEKASPDRAHGKATKRVSVLRELLVKITPQNLHRAEDWGKAVGAEAW
jgi:hypothetical protein